MKKIFLLFIITSNSMFCQKYIDTLYNFKATEGSIVWQKVFENDQKELKKVFKQNILNKTKATNLMELETSISYNIESDLINIKKHGGSLLFSAFFIQEENNYFVNIDFKDQKYRVTIRNFTSSATSATVKISLEDYILSKNKMKNNKFNKKNLKIYDDYFTDKFTITNKKENW